MIWFILAIMCFFIAIFRRELVFFILWPKKMAQIAKHGLAPTNLIEMVAYIIKAIPMSYTLIRMRKSHGDWNKTRKE